MSDSESDFDEVEVGLTSVLLGFAGKEAIRDDLSAQGNHIGGIPIWHGPQRTPFIPHEDLLLCKVCTKKLNLLAQLSCPLPEKTYDRTIYVFACSDPNCRRKEGSVRAIRGIDNSSETQNRIKREIEETKPENNLGPEIKLGDTLFSSASPAGNPFASTLDATSVASNTAPSQNQSTKKKFRNKKNMQSIPGRYVCKVIEVEEEYLDNLDQSLGDNVKIEEMDTEPDVEPPAAGPGDDVPASVSDDSEKIKEFESRNDPVFRHFVDIVESNPEQVSRYEIGLKPLLYTGSDKVAKELKSLDTTHKKKLEIQLMPHLIAELETNDMLLDGMEWGTIFVACDIDDTLPELNVDGVGYVEEWVGVQWE